MGLMWVLLALVLMGALLMIMRFLANAATHQVESPERILRRRYAAGEIDQGTYEHMLDELCRQSSRGGDESDE